jgi:hypothetical protein
VVAVEEMAVVVLVEVEVVVEIQVEVDEDSWCKKNNSNFIFNKHEKKYFFSIDFVLLWRYKSYSTR